MFEQEDSLPCPECKLPIDYRDAQAGIGQYRAQMCRHIVRTFRSMEVVGVPVGHSSCKPTFKVVKHLRVGVFANNQGGAGVVDKNGGSSLLTVGIKNHFFNLIADVETAAPAGIQLELMLVDNEIHLPRFYGYHFQYVTRAKPVCRDLA